MRRRKYKGRVRMEENGRWSGGKWKGKRKRALHLHTLKVLNY